MAEEHIEQNDEDVAFAAVMALEQTGENDGNEQAVAPTPEGASEPESRGPATPPETPEGQPSETATPPDEEGEEPAPEEGAPQDDPERAAQMEATTLGRLKAEQKRNQELQQRLNEAEQRMRQGTVSPPAAQTSADLVGVIPEELRDDFADFSKTYPELAPIVAMPGRDGDRLRQALRDSGPHTAAALAQPLFMQVVRENERQSRFLQSVGARHPEVLDFANPDRLTEAFRFRGQVESWIKNTFTANDAIPKLTLLDQPDEQGVIALLDEYKTATANNVGAQTAGTAAASSQAAQREREAQAAAAVPSRPAMPRINEPEKKDADAAFEEVFRQGQR